MPKDYKHRAGRKKKRKKVSPWFGLLAGLAIGLFVAFLVFIKMQTPLSPRAIIEGTAPQAAVTPSQDTRAVRKEEQDIIPPPPKPIFNFYETLPEMEVVVPEIEVVIPEKAIKGKAEAGVKQVKQPGNYALQVGSFRGAEQADRFKAELVLQGFEVTVQTVTINNTDTYHRVRIGPFKDLDALNKARSRLNKQGIENKLIKITG
jgi:cell division protein FtsN